MIAEHRRLLDSLAAEGLLPDCWRPAFERVPRHLFVPDAVWAGGTLRPVVRRQEPAAWLANAYGDHPVVTQMDDGRATPGGDPGTFPSSAISQPAIVAVMLKAALIEEGMRVLEIGTGSGWNAGLLAARLGDDAVFTVEIDPELASGARRSLAAAKLRPTVITGDGAQGYPAAAPYDRVLATCSVASVPYEWIRQTRPGGQVLTPWHTGLFNGLLLRLQVGDDGTATGRFVGTAVFMALRAQRPPGTTITAGLSADRQTSERSTGLHPSRALDFEHAQLAVSLRVPDCYQWWDGADGGHLLRLNDPISDSWATVTVPADQVGPYRVRQVGPRRLWNEIEAAYGWWTELGTPDYDRFGVTVDEAGQHVWLDQPGRRIA